MKIGLNLPQLGPHAARMAVRGFALEAEACGFDSLWVQDHVLWPHHPQSGYAGRPGAPIPQEYRSMLAPLETLAYVAALTERVRVGTSVLVTAYHRPARLAQQLATLDLLSGGRVICGLGLGWSKDEADQMDTPFTRRGARMADFIRALRACWLPDPVTYAGPFFRIPAADLSPKPVQRDAEGRPAVPIVLGLGSAAGMARTAELADGWNPAGRPAEMVRATLREIQAMAEARGRTVRMQSYMRVFVIPADVSPAQVLERPFGPISWVGPAAQLSQRVAEARQAGIDHLIIDTSFSGEIDGPDAWPAHVRYLAPLAAAAHG